MRSGAHCQRKKYMAKKNEAAVQLGRRGGNATAKNLTAEQRKQNARKAAQARWAKGKKLG